jgi:L,D-peptidoglycan transpeptidase YkuD (ErfK/YbiS/YcfS/YnhG family)
MAAIRRVPALAGLLLVLSAFVPASGAEEPTWSLPSESSQLIVGIASDWNSSKVTLRRFERQGTSWRIVGKPFPGRLGVKGLVWGRGVHPRTDEMSDKAEGDGRAPAGAFTLGLSFGYEEKWKAKTKLPYVKVGTRDLLVEDPSSDLYNKYVRLDREPSTAFEKKQQMKQNDPVHRLKIFINHNVDPEPVPGKGSAILFHIWRRGGEGATLGCTSISDASIEAMMGWLDPAKNPIYVLLPAREYRERQETWGLPKL